MCRPKADGNILNKTSIRLRAWSVCHLKQLRRIGHSRETRQSASSLTRTPLPLTTRSAIKHNPRTETDDLDHMAPHLYQHEIRLGLSHAPMQPDGGRLRRA